MFIEISGRSKGMEVSEADQTEVVHDSENPEVSAEKQQKSDKPTKTQARRKRRSKKQTAPTKEVLDDAVLAQKRVKNAFKAIRDFVGDLHEQFGEKGVDALSLYNRLLSRSTQSGDASDQTVTKSIEGFKLFLEEHDEIVSSGEFEKLPKDAFIRFNASDRIYIDVRRYYLAADPETKLIIQSHLVAIGARLNPSKDKLDQIKKVEETRKKLLKKMEKGAEGKMLKEVFKKVQSKIETLNTADPTTAIMDLLSSGVATEMWSTIQKGVDSGTMKPGRLMKHLKKMANDLLPQIDDSSSDDED